MDRDLVQKSLNFCRRKKKLILLLTALGFTSYGAYKVYNLPAVAKKRQRILKLLEAMFSIAGVVADSAETVGVVSRDLKQFLQSDSDEIPTSLKQISKIAKSEEFSESLARVTQAVTIGILRGYKSETKRNGETLYTNNDSSFSDKIVDKLFTTAGSDFASVVVGSFARNMVLGFYSVNSLDGDSNSIDRLNAYCFRSDVSSVPKWVSMVCSDKCREVIGDCIQMFVSTAVAVYLDKTMNINTYDEIFSGLTNPRHETKVRDFLVSVCNGAVETLVKTSHEVLTNSNSISNVKLNLKLNSNVKSNLNSNSSSLAMDHMNGTKSGRYKDFGDEALEMELKERNLIDGMMDNWWVDKVSSTLSVPNNRRFVLDLTGRVTFETVRACLDFFLWRVLDCLKRSSKFVHEEVIVKGVEVLRYISAKSAVIFTVCIALCLRVVYGTRMMIPA